MLTAENDLPMTVSTLQGTAAGCMSTYLNRALTALFICCRKLTSVKALYVGARVDDCPTKQFTAISTRFNVRAVIARHGCIY